MAQSRLKVAIHKLTSCSGCQLALLNQGETLLELLELIDITHFIEAGICQPEGEVDLALVEGSVSTPEDLVRAKQIRNNSKLVVSIGACATSGGVQALRNLSDGHGWQQAVYARPEFIQSLATSTGLSEHIRVDGELWGCPVTKRQVNYLIRQLLYGASPQVVNEKLCLQCKRNQQVCVMITRQTPCLGPVVRTGCGALCPAFGRGCYGCFGPSEQPNCRSLSNRFTGLGLLPEEIVRQFAGIHSHSEPFRRQILHWQAQAIEITEIPTHDTDGGKSR